MERVEMTIANDFEDYRRLSGAVGRFISHHRLDERTAYAVRLVVDEIVSNVIRHAYEDAGRHEIAVSIDGSGDVITIRVEDDGKPFDPRNAPAPPKDLPLESRPIGGLGLFLVANIAERIDYRREGGRNSVTITVRGA